VRVYIKEYFDCAYDISVGKKRLIVALIHSQTGINSRFLIDMPPKLVNPPTLKFSYKEAA
jgi:hypothetical protein